MLVTFIIVSIVIGIVIIYYYYKKYINKKRYSKFIQNELDRSSHIFNEL